MIITQTPFRISFFGGGTDYKPHYLKYGGCCLSTTIDKYCYLNVRDLPPFFQHRSHIVYSKVENVSAYNEIEHPVVRESMRLFNMKNKSILHDGDLPARTGLGTSSAFTVGLLNAFHAMKGEYIDKISLAKEAIYLEHDILKENVGVQDQLAVSVGGLNYYQFIANGFSVEPIPIDREKKHFLNRHLLLYFTGISRYSSDIAGEQIKNMSKNTLDLLEIADMANAAKKLLLSTSHIHEFGELLHQTWLLKKTLTNNISSTGIDNLYNKALKSGAIGGKLLGAGGGGFILFFVPEEKQAYFKKCLQDYLLVPFNFEENGSRVIYYKE